MVPIVSADQLMLECEYVITIMAVFKESVNMSQFTPVR